MIDQRPKIAACTSTRTLCMLWRDPFPQRKGCAGPADVMRETKAGLRKDALRVCITSG
jgi:hypothetical protein